MPFRITLLAAVASSVVFAQTNVSLMVDRLRLKGVIAEAAHLSVRQ